MDLEVIESDLFPVLQTKSKEKYVSAYDLYVELGMKKNIKYWIERILTSKWIKEGRDYIISKDDITGHFGKNTIQSILVDTFSDKNNKSQVNARNVIFSLEAAKHICIMSDTENGYMIREYLLKIEKEFMRLVEFGAKNYWRNMILRYEADRKLNFRNLYLNERYVKTDRLDSIIDDKIISNEDKMFLSHYKHIIQYAGTHLQKIREICISSNRNNEKISDEQLDKVFGLTQKIIKV